MSREAHIPLVLWITAALVFHFVGGGGTQEIARTVLDRQQLRALVQAERAGLRPSDQTFEIMDLQAPSVPSEQPAVAPDKESEPGDDEVDPDPTRFEMPRNKPADAKDKAPKPPDAPKPDALPKPPEPEKKLVPALPVPAAPAPPPPPPKPDGRIAIKQHADKNQPDNPEASRIADEANHVKEETQAKIRSHDQDEAKPTPGAAKSLGPKDEIGNSEHDKEAESEDRKGREDRAPGEAAPISTSGSHSTPGNPGPKDLAHSPPPSVPGAQGGARAAVGALPGASMPSPGGAGPTSPEVQNGGGKSGWSMDPANPGGDGSSRIAGRRHAGQPTYQSPVHAGSIGLGGSGAPGGPNINLTMQGFEAAIGADKLRQEREADGASRRGEHAGRMARATDFQRYKAAIENYDPSVKLGEGTALNAARVAWAGYLNSIHNKIHPFFAERELDAMDKYSNKDFNDQHMYTVAEIVIAPDTGRIVRRGIVKGSGSTAYDTIVLKSIDSSAPYGKAPDAIISPDGKVYLHWEFHRNHFDACSTRNAFPLMRRATVAKATPSPNGAPPKPATKTDETPGASPNAGPLRPLHE